MARLNDMIGYSSSFMFYVITIIESVSSFSGQLHRLSPSSRDFTLITNVCVGGGIDWYGGQVLLNVVEVVESSDLGECQCDRHGYWMLRSYYP